ncbi:MAG: lysophospholipid acyltransferase family protein [Gemmatimonadaceae bacterium]
MNAPPVAARPRLAHRAEFWALRAVLAALSHTDWQRAGDIGARVALLGYRPFGIRRNVVEKQVAAAFPELGAAAVTAITRGAYEHLGRVTGESAVVPSLGREGVLEMFEAVEGWEHIERPMDAGRGLVLVGGHFGNWELSGTYLAARGVPVDVIVRRMSNPLFDAYLNALRLKLGMTVVYDNEAVRRTPRALAAGRAVGLLADQGGKGIAAIHVPFFGRPARTPHGPAVFALRGNTPMVFIAAVRVESGRYRMIVEPVPLEQTGERERDVEALVRRYTGVLEKWVRAYPEQYFWHHHRWKRQPPETPLELRDPVRS